MELELTERSQQLLDILMTIPPKLDVAKEYLDANHLSADEVTRVANVYADKCFLDYGDYLFETYPDCNLSTLEINHSIVPELHSAYIYDIVKLLLRYGMDPNTVYIVEYNHYNIMNLVVHIDHGYLAADTMGLLLENGGDPNLAVEIETIYEYVADDVWFGAIEQEIRWRYDSWVHLWMVLLAYGGKPRGKKCPLEVFREYDSTSLFDVKKLKNHRDYIYGISKENYEPVIHIFDKKTLWEVAKA